jgi:hypothetical protein
VRRADGGAGMNGNIAWACCWCNSNRGTASVDEHKQRVVALVSAGEHPVANAYRALSAKDGDAA